MRSDEAALTEAVVSLAGEYGRYGYRRATALLRAQGWLVNDKRVDRIWRQEGLKVPRRQPKRGRLWLDNGSCVRLRPEQPNHVWNYDFVEDRTNDGRRCGLLNVLDEFTHACLTIRVGRKLKAADVIDLLSGPFILRGGLPTSDLTAVPSSWPRRCRAGSGGRSEDGLHRARQPLEDGYVGSFNAWLRDELLDGEIFHSLREAEEVIES